MKRFTFFTETPDWKSGLRWVVLAVLISTTAALGAVPQLINFQGILKDGSGNPVADGSYSVIFTIYDASAGGTVLWAETTSVITTDGLFSALLGADNPVSDSAFNDSSRYLGIKVGVDPEMTPRQRLTTSGYSFRSEEWTSAAQNLFRLSGNVGIGIDAPSVRLHAGSVGSEGIPSFIAGTQIAAQATNPDNWAHMAIISGSAGQARLNFGDGFNDDQGSVGYNNLTDAMFFRTATAERMRITSSGRVGIGMTDPQSPFVVQGASNWGLAEVVGNDGFNNEASIGFRTSAQNKGDLGTWVLGLNNNSGPLTAFSLYAANGFGAGSQAVTVLPSGNVGIGSNNPVNKLDVEGGTAIGATYAGANTAPTNGLLVEGNVGIGTVSPAARLHVHDPSGTINGSRLTLTQTATGSTIFDGAALICASPNKAYWWNYENGPSILGTNNTERMRIDSAGNAGIGIDVPTARLQVGSVGSEGIPSFIAGTMVAAQATNPDNWTHMAIISGSFGQSRLNFGDGANDDQGSVAYNNSNDAMFFMTTAAERMRITSAGNVGIGTTGPTSRLQVNGALATVVTATTANLTLSETNSIILASTPGVSDVVITLPTAVGITGRQYTIKKTDAAAHTVIVDANGAETIDGAFLYNLTTQNKYVTVVSNGANWFVIANN